MGKRSARIANLSHRATLEALAPDPAKQYFVWDERLPGFSVVVRPTGAKRWVVFYRFHGVQRRLVLGDLQKLTPQQARSLAMQYLAKAEDARAHPDLPIPDPATERRTKRQASLEARRAERERPTVGVVADRYLTTLDATRSEKWAREARRIIDTYVPEALLALPVAEVTTEDIRGLHEQLRGTPIQANRVRTVLHSVFTRAIESGDLPAPMRNPVAAVAPYPKRSRARNLGDQDPTEWARFGEAWRTLRAEAEAAPPHDTRRHQLDAILFLLLTGARHNAARVRRWADVRWDRRLLVVEPAHKGVSMVPLGAAALDHLKAMQPTNVSKGDYLFPGQQRGGRATAPIARCDGVAWEQLLARADITGLTIHDLRRTFATVAAEIGIAEHLQDGLIGHRVPGIRGVYARQNLNPLLDAADSVAAAVRQRLEAPPIVSPTVLPIETARRGRGTRP